MELAVTTGLDPVAIERALEHDPRYVATMIDVLKQRAEASAAKQKKGGRRRGRR